MRAQEHFNEMRPHAGMERQMAYQINYYADRAMRRPAAESDTIGDGALLRYPAPTGKEVAYARHSENRQLDAYGYDGEWYGQPPAETIEADTHEEEEAKKRRDVVEYAARPHVKGGLRHDSNTLVISLPGQRESAYLTISELRAAARQDDPDRKSVV